MPQVNWTQKHCKPCEGGVESIDRSDAEVFLNDLPEWTLASDADAIFRKIIGDDFVDVVTMVNRIADLAEAESHHPDLHLTGYRHLKIVLTTHAIDGLSENDFILAAKLDALLSNRD